MEAKEIKDSIDKLRQDIRQDIKEIQKDTKEIPAIKQALIDLKENFQNHLSKHEKISTWGRNLIGYIIAGVLITLLIKIITMLE